MRELSGDSLRSLAARAGIDPATLMRIEDGTSLGRPETLKAIARGLDCPLLDIVESSPAETEAVA